MTTKHPDFTDVFYANSLARAAVKKGLRLQEAGDHKGARAALKDAMRLQKQAERLERVVKRGKVSHSQASPIPRTTRQASDGTRERSRTGKRR
jgi:hypothetical protein